MTDAEIAAMSKEEKVDAVFSHAWKASQLLCRGGLFRLRRKPIYGGVFGGGVFQLCSFCRVDGGLDAVTFLVADKDVGFVLASGDDKHSALSLARDVLTAAGTVRVHQEIARFHAARESERAEQQQLLRQQHEADKEQPSNIIRSIPRRRRRIFDESGGKCHYCQCDLQLDGLWHIEHKMPRALGGDNSPTNLVASCAPCNHAKRDTTDQEFMAKRSVLQGTK